MTATGAPAGAWQLTPLELAAGLPLGHDPDLVPLAVTDDGPRAAVEAAVLGALLRPPCVVSFSGGRDSSTVLALAAHVAAREGLAPPVAVTLRFPRLPESDESEWQRQVVDHVGVREWTLLDTTDELDLLGDDARDQIRRHGVLWPPNTHFHQRIAALAAGGSLLTGFAGDEVMSPGSPWDRLAHVQQGQVRPRASDAARRALAASPRAVRRAVLARRPDPTPARPWLRPHAADALRRAKVGAEAELPVRPDDALVDGWWRARYRTVATASLARVGADHDAVVVHPFTEPGVLSALAGAHRVRLPRSRAQALGALVGDLLPAEVLVRRSKAEFGRAFWGPGARDFAHGWDGTGVDSTLVDPDTLHTAWSADRPDGRSFALLQHAWAASARAGGASADDGEQ
ncbi:hypothetical protein GCM10010972_18410 [Cellulomonas carbonis]|nr:hypothetical protein GCM10010972_18410 [Cellulomonas carbonis]